jgi:hypothetical protein
MTVQEAREIVIEAMNYAAYKETDSSLFDSDKNRLYGSDHYNSGRLIVRPSPWVDDFETKMVQLLQWAHTFSRSDAQFKDSLRVLLTDSCPIGNLVRKLHGSGSIQL